MKDFKNMFAIKTCRMNENKIVRQLPTSFWQRRKRTSFIFSPLPQISITPSLEIPCTVTICFPASMKADMLIGKYKEIVESLDIQPKNKVTVCCFVEKNDYDKGVIREKNSKIEQNKTNDTRNFLKITGKLKNGEN